MEKNLVVIICVGIPASGKSTWAKEKVKKSENFCRLNRDSFRYMLKDVGFTEPKIEAMITNMFFHAIDISLAARENIIIDNTNLKASVINEIVAYVEHRADVEYMLFELPAEKAIERDLLRENPVGEIVINKMYGQYKILTDSFVFQNQSKKKYVYKEPIKNPLLPSIVLFDLDGTLAHANGKRKYNDWKYVDRDDLDLTMHGIYKRHRLAGDRIGIITGRSEEAKIPTEEWLSFYDIKHDALFMRKEDDHRRDTVVKREIFVNQIKDVYNIDLVYEDRPPVVEMWRSLGIKTLQVEKGYI